MVIDHFETFVSGYDSRYRETYGKLRAEAQNAFLNFRRCGDPNFGITLFRCNTCDVSLEVPFTCKARICPVWLVKPRLIHRTFHTTQKRFTRTLSDIQLPRVPHMCQEKPANF
jgi:Transposase zinc-binding domain